MIEKIVDINIKNDSVEKTVNDQLEWLFDKFLSSNKKNELKNLDFSTNDRKTKAENIFDARLKSDPTIIDKLINIDDNIEEQVETEVKKIWIDLNILQNEIEIKTALENLKLKTPSDPNTLKLIEKIEKNPDFDPDAVPDLKEYVKDGKRGKAIQEVFKILWRFFKKDNETWFNEYSDLELDLEKKTDTELENMKNIFENKIENASWIKKDLKFAYILSQINNKILENNWTTDKKEQLKENLEIGDIILLNKKLKKLDSGSKALKAYDSKYETDFIHSAIIISKNPIKIRHATTFTTKKTWKWHVEEVNLFDYLNTSGTESFDLLSLRPDENTKNKILDFSEQNLDKEYDNNAALWWGIRWNDSDWTSALWWLRKNKKWEKDNSFNCVEIIAQSLDNEKIKKITHPNEFLKYMHIFQPTYLTTI